MDVELSDLPLTSYILGTRSAGRTNRRSSTA
jgi:hypothetical protein